MNTVTTQRLHRRMARFIGFPPHVALWPANSLRETLHDVTILARFQAHEEVRCELVPRRVHFGVDRASLLQSLTEHACLTTPPSFRATFTRIFLSPSVAKAAGFFPRTDESFSTLQARPRSSTSGTACPKSAAPWLSNPRSWLSRTPRNFIPHRRKNLRLGFFR